MFLTFVYWESSLKREKDKQICIFLFVHHRIRNHISLISQVKIVQMNNIICRLILTTYGKLIAKKNLCNFLGLIFHNQMLEFQQFCQAFSMCTTLHKLLEHVQGHLLPFLSVLILLITLHRPDDILLLFYSIYK